MLEENRQTCPSRCFCSSRFDLYYNKLYVARASFNQLNSLEYEKPKQKHSPFRRDTVIKISRGVVNVHVAFL